MREKCGFHVHQPGMPNQVCKDKTEGCLGRDLLILHLDLLKMFAGSVHPPHLFIPTGNGPPRKAHHTVVPSELGLFISSILRPDLLFSEQGGRYPREERENQHWSVRTALFSLVCLQRSCCSISDWERNDWGGGEEAGVSDACTLK